MKNSNLAAAGVAFRDTVSIVGYNRCKKWKKSGSKACRWVGIHICDLPNENNLLIKFNGL